jgi:drug/metabolite transporter (DMT)-like permease
MPLRYSRIIILLISGILVTEERPSLSMLFGSALVTFSGLYIIWREQLLAKRPDRK